MIRTTAGPADWTKSARGFTVIWSSSFLVFVAMSLGTFSLNWALARLPGGGGLLGATVAVSSLVSLLVVVVVAGVIDRSDRRAMLLTMKAGTGALSVALLVVYLLGLGRALLTAVAMAIYVGLQALQALYQAGTETTLADAAPERWAGARTASLVQLQQQASRFAAPILGGPLLAAAAVWRIPIVGLLGVGAGVAILLTRPMDAWSAGTVVDRVGWRPFFVIRRAVNDARWAGRWIAERPLLVYMLSVSILNSLVVLPLYSLLAVYLISSGVHGVTLVYSAASAAYGIGVVGGSALFSRVTGLSRWPVASSAGAVLVVSLTVVVLAVRPDPVVIESCMLVLGLSFALLVAVVGGVWLVQTPAQVRVRVFSLRRLLSFISIPIGSLMLGAGGTMFGFARVLLVLGVATVLGMIGSLVALQRSRAPR